MAWGDSGIVLSSLQPEVDYVPKSATLVPWRLCTNFVNAQRILERFGEWPDSLLEPEGLESLYRGEAKRPIQGLSVVDGHKVVPSFPYLDESEAERVVKVYEAAKSRIYPRFGAFLQDAGTEALGGAEGMLLPTQTLLVFALRERERQAGIWDMRTSEQRLGTVFALGPSVNAIFSRVSALIVGNGMRLCVPWGGVYCEYSKLLPVLEDPYTGWILRTADEDLHVMMAGPVSRPLALLGLIDLSRMLAARGQARLNADVVPASDVVRNIPVLYSAVRDIAAGASVCLDALLDLWREGRYVYLEGPGDYFEMTYAVLLGLLFTWAMDDGLLKRPPSLARSGENLVLRKSLWSTIARTKARFHGVCVLRGADVIWDSFLGAAKSCGEGDP